MRISNDFYKKSFKHKKLESKTGIEVLKVYKYLGILFDDKMSFKKILQKVNKNSINRNSNYLKKDANQIREYR